MKKEETKVPTANIALKRKKYIVKAKQLYTSSSSSIIAWLSLNEEDFNEDQTSDKCLIWIGFKDELDKRYNELNKDYRVLSEQYINEFRAVNKKTIQHIYEITDNDVAQNMFWSIENFICSLTVKL